MVELPSIKTDPWRVRDWVSELASAALAFVLATLALLRPGVARWQVVVTLTVLAGIFAISGRKAYRTRRAELKYEPVPVPNELLGGLRGMHAHLCRVRSRTAEALAVRLVVYKVHWDRRRTAPTELEQITTYVGGAGGEVGRRISARAGIVGRVARLPEPVVAKRLAADTESFRSELVTLWSFTRPEARQISVDRWAWMAMPLAEADGHVYGVVYLDTTDVNGFDDVAVYQAVAADCGVLAAICQSVYGST